MDKTIIGIDIGGSHITAALVDLEKKSIVPESKIRERVDSHGSASQIIDSWSEVIQKVAAYRDAFPRRIGIAMPGPFNYERGVSLIKNQDKFDALYGLDVSALLAKRLEMSPENLYFMNDAASFLLGELFGGAVQGFERAIGLTLGTGLGTASYAQGITRDANLWSSPFKEGIAEDYLCSRWMVRTYYLQTGKKVKDVKELAGLWGKEPVVEKIFDDFGENLALFLISFIHKDKPEVVVMGGNITKAFDLFYPALSKSLKKHNIKTPIRRAKLGEEAALIGAASNCETNKSSNSHK